MFGRVVWEECQDDELSKSLKNMYGMFDLADFRGQKKMQLNLALGWHTHKDVSSHSRQVPYNKRHSSSADPNTVSTFGLQILRRIRHLLVKVG